MTANTTQTPPWWQYCANSWDVDAWECYEDVSPETHPYLLELRLTFKDGRVRNFYVKLPLKMRNGEDWDFSEKVLLNPPSVENDIQEVTLLSATKRLVHYDVFDMF